MSIVRYDPFGSLNRLHGELNRLFQDSVAGNDDQSRVVTGTWSPAVDIREESDRYVITADVPGVKPEDIEVTLEDGVLTLKGERRVASADTAEGLKRVERAQGVFYRRFALPDNVDTESVRAHGAHGVLEIEVPKGGRAEARRIQVNAGG